MNQVTRRTWTLVALLAITCTLQAQTEPEKLPLVAEKTHRHADLDIPAMIDEVRQLPPQAAAEARQRLARMGVVEATARVDRRSGRFATLLPTEPMVPGNGVGNDLRQADLKVPDRASRTVRENAAEQAFDVFLRENAADLGIHPDEIPGYKVTSYGETTYQVYAPRVFDGIPVRDSYVTGVISHGNLTLMGTHQWGGRPAPSNRPRLTAEQARFEAEAYLAPLAVTREWGPPELVYVPMARGNTGYRYQLAWSVKVHVADDEGSWELLVDAHRGEILANEDRNHYGEIKGGVYPMSNDGIVPDGVEQAGWPMPFIDVTTLLGLQVSDTGGNVPAGGILAVSGFTGPYVRVFDDCGSVSLTQKDVVDFGGSGGTDCVTPGFGGPGNTHASRTSFYELNKIIEMARGQLPSNLWLQSQLTTNVNLSFTCNAYWNGTLNFSRSGGGCPNPGEMAGVFDHEWGHGMDQNDAVPGISAPSGEGIADLYAALRLHTSCIGRGLSATVCSFFGDPCLTCTGSRDIDYLKHVSGNPHDYTWANANCGGSVHCLGVVYAEAVWSLWKRQLQSAPYNYDNNAAHEITNRLTYVGGGNTGTWFSGGPPWGGCAASSGYMSYLAADDDNGDVNDGTPHMTAIYNAFNDQEIACNTPAVQDSGCAGLSPVAPLVTATAGNNSVTLSWMGVGGATTRYQIFRTEGVHGCDFGKVRLGETSGTSWTDSGLQNGRDYSYVVIPTGAADACMGYASACATVTPSAQ